MRSIILVATIILCSPKLLWADNVEESNFYDSQQPRSNITILPPRYDIVASRTPRLATIDIYGEATKYYHTQVSNRSRGLDWWVADDLFAQPYKAESSLVERDRSRLRLSASTQEYNYGILAEGVKYIFGDWSLEGLANIRWGKSLYVDGVFRRDIRPELRLSKLYSYNHYLTFELQTPTTLRGLQSSASSEAFELTGNKYYNPSWGLYDGEVRNSRVRRTIAPQLHSRYQRPLGDKTMMAIESEISFTRRSTSQLEWYDGYSPQPDYYRKMPSYYPQNTIQLEIEQMWRDSDPDYTQINWDRMVELNQGSPSGSAYYVLADEVTHQWHTEAQALFTSRINTNLKFNYGIILEGERSRNFEELRDLLGGDYLLDIDPYIGDYTHTSSDAQSDLRNPNRKVLQGERFGYDYTIDNRSIQGILGLTARGRNLSVELNGRFGDQYIHRLGHYENGRFVGSLSYGESQHLSLPLYNVDTRLSYTLPDGSHLALRLQSMTLAAAATDLFIQEEYANRLVDTPVSQRLNSLSLRYSFAAEGFLFNIDGYIMRSRDETQTWRVYDDLSYTYSDCVISGIGTQSIGFDLVCNYRVTQSFRVDMAIAAGIYRYDVAPQVTLYDDYDLSTFSTATASAVEGCIVGNAPQLMVTTGFTYFVNYGLILSADCSYSASRYVSPSFVRRSDRVVRGVTSPELQSEIIEQEQLPNAFDITLSVVRTFWLRHGNRMSLTARIDNLLGTTPVVYGREGNRVLSHSGASTTDSYYLQSNSYIYGSPRTLYLSCNYYF
ncbi:MAG: hypothetical protein SNH63_03835 [Rikenellaceae bacterium]